MYTAIHSQQVAQAIINAGQPLVRLEPNRQVAGKLVFIFESTPIVTEVLERSRRPGRPHRLPT